MPSPSTCISPYAYVAVDSTTLEADAAMKSIVRRDSGEDWQAYVISLMRSEGLLPDGKDPTDEEVRRFDKQRKGKKVSNEDWKSPTDPESKIAKMKDGITHLAYKAEHVVDLDSGILLGAEVMSADKSDPASLEDSLHHAQTHLEAAGSDIQIQEVAAHSTEVLSTLSDQTNYRTYIPEPKVPGGRNWSRYSSKQRKAVVNNRRRARGKKGRKLQRMRSEQVERTFAHVLETGGGRRCRLRGKEKIQKRYHLMTAAYNLGVIMRRLFGIGTSRSLHGMWRAIFARFWVAIKAPRRLNAILKALLLPEERFGAYCHRCLTEITGPRRSAEIAISSTGC